MVPFIKEIGLLIQIRKTAEEFKFGQMDQGTTDFGKMVWQMVTEDLFTLKEMCMKVNGSTIKQMAMEFTHISMAADTRDSGFKTSSMVWVLNSGQMVLNMKDFMSKE